MQPSADKVYASSPTSSCILNRSGIPEMSVFKFSLRKADDPPPPF